MPLFILPFDHRSSFSKLIGFTYPTNRKGTREAKAMKEVIFDGFLQARNQVENKDQLAILVDEEFGTDILKKAKKKNIKFAQTVEKTSQEFFDFNYEDDFDKHLLRYKPEFAKALVRYNPNQHKANKIQNAKLKKLSDFCMKEDIKLIIELLVQEDNKKEVLMRSIQQILKAGVEPSVWKLEGLPHVKDWIEMRRATYIPIIVLGRGSSKKKVDEWLSVAAKSNVVDGFAVGRTIFASVISDYSNKKIARKVAVERIAKNYLHFIKLWEKSVK
ncbi:MAG: DUF2090 domain-containing protein [Candidatus Uhrbacteria bacterium]|nr:DUF2090 domain-containing protein [Candidatus Uhrbacteria bacterium]